MSTSSRPSSPLLPAFGIRFLKWTQRTTRVVQISARQYDSTINSQSDATLGYVDLDDGELITVGTSFELRQRLEEPVYSPIRSVRSSMTGAYTYRPERDATENVMHLFDIRRSSGSMAVWRDHEAYTSKILRLPDTSSSSFLQPD